MASLIIAVLVGAAAVIGGRVGWELLLAARWQNWRRAHHWRRTLCPHGHFYTAELQRGHCARDLAWQPCPHNCHVTLYGYRRKVRRDVHGRPLSPDR